MCGCEHEEAEADDGDAGAEADPIRGRELLEFAEVDPARHDGEDDEIDLFRLDHISVGYTCPIRTIDPSDGTRACVKRGRFVEHALDIVPKASTPVLLSSQTQLGRFSRESNTRKSGL